MKHRDKFGQGPIIRQLASRVSTALLVTSLLVAPTIAAAQATPASQATAAKSEESQEQPLTTAGGPNGYLAVRDIAAPQPLVVRGRVYIVYEISLTNFQTRPIRLTSLSAQAGRRARLKWGGKALATMVDMPSRYGADRNALVIPSLETRILLIWLRAGAAGDLPARVSETVHYRFADATGGAAGMKVTTSPQAIDLSPPPVIGPPVAGRLWLAANGPSNTSGHARAFFVVQGHVYFPERFAIDFVQFGANGMTYSGDPKKNQSYHCYGADALAVDDGVVVATKDGIPENIPGSLAIPITLGNMGGNYVLLKIGRDRYAFYAHLIPGSIRVKVGQHVRRGAILGRVGNSGNSTEPHLHFHIVDGPSTLGADAMAYEFSDATLVPGRVELKDDDFKFVTAKRPKEKVRNSLVLENDVIDFPSR